MSENFKTVQQQFVNAIKDPDSFETNNADIKRRMDIYQSLFFNNIMGFISTGSVSYTHLTLPTTPYV